MVELKSDVLAPSSSGSSEGSSPVGDHELAIMTATVASTPASTNGTNGTSSDHHNGITSNGSSSGNTQYTVEYLSQLLKDKKQLAAFPNVFHHLERLADEEISKVRVALFQFEFTKEQLQLPDPEGEVQTITEKVFVPAKEHPDYNFVGRILGPRGMTAKQLEQETGCKIMVRGRGSMRDKKKEEMNRGKPNWEHLSEELHVLIQCEDTPNRAQIKLMRAVQEVRKLLVPAPEGEDELKRKQLMELAIINGTYRSANQQQTTAAQLAVAAAAKQPLTAALQAAASIAASQGRMLPVSLAGNHAAAAAAAAALRSPTLAGAPIILSPSSRPSAGAQNSATAAQMLQLQQFSGQYATAAATQGANAVAAAQQAALLQQQQQAAVDYQQMLLGQSLANGYDGLNGVPATAYQQQQQYVAAMLQAQAGAANPYLTGDYAGAGGMDVHTGAMLCQRRVLGQSREHPYATAKPGST